MKLGESVISHRATQALRIHECQLPILLATLETFPNPKAVNTLRELPITMYETHRGKQDLPEVFRETQSQWEEENGLR